MTRNDAFLGWLLCGYLFDIQIVVQNNAWLV